MERYSFKCWQRFILINLLIINVLNRLHSYWKSSSWLDSPKSFRQNRCKENPDRSSSCGTFVRKDLILKFSLQNCCKERSYLRNRTVMRKALILSFSQQKLCKVSSDLSHPNSMIIKTALIMESFFQVIIVLIWEIRKLFSTVLVKGWRSRWFLNKSSDESRMDS